MNKKKQDNALLLLIVGLVMIVLAWKFGYSDMNKKSDTVKNEVDKLDQIIIQRTTYKNNAGTYEDEKKKFEEQKNTYLKYFPSEVNSEDILYIAKGIQELQSDNDATPVSAYITGITINPAEEVYGSDKKDNKNNSGATTASGTSATSQTTSTDTKESAGSDLKGYVENVSFDFQFTSYKGLKKMINYINSYQNRCNVTEINVSYDSTIGGDDFNSSIEQCLSGTITFNIFYVNGKDYSNYEAPKVDNSYQNFKVVNPFLPGVAGSTTTDTTNKNNKAAN